jgi:hypothetical protein
MTAPPTGREPNRFVKFLTSVGGVLTAVATIITAVVTIVALLAGRDSGPPTSARQPPVTQQPQPVPSGQPEPSSRVRVDQQLVRVPATTSGCCTVDLDSLPPLAADGIDGGDIYVDVSPPELEGSSRRLAPLPAGAPIPTEADCVTRLEANRASRGDLTRGARYCVQTDAGRVAFVHILSVPAGSGTVQLRVTVWEVPS